MYPPVDHQTNQPILDVSHLTIRYGNNVALEDASFQLHPGDLVAVVGPNGAGKSTLFKALAGILSTNQGEIKIYGSQPGYHVCIAYLPQRSHFDWNFPVSVADVVMMGRIAKLGLFGWPRKADWEYVHQSLETVGLANLEKQQIGNLSGGQQQRMLIARALAEPGDVDSSGGGHRPGSDRADAASLQARRLPYTLVRWGDRWGHWAGHPPSAARCG